MLKLGGLEKFREAKFAGGIFATVLLRLLQIIPNVEPIMAFTSPYAKAYGALAGFAFALISLVSFDFISGRLGVWTLYCGVAYGLIGLFAAYYFKSRSKRVHYATYAFVATIAYDAVTAFLFGLQFNQPLWLTLLGQIPFTMYHVVGNVLFAAVVSPAIYDYVLAQPGAEVNPHADKVVH